ncbi:hypothetical protein BJY24_006231 [Nocardia transvalensis]|uniref:DUF8176 domain-containing protein n=1 Tax=Nocardia transvalensis TaxID=37333 RepID=A0A7W9PJI0_9NOCA|nr:hypothetical protein [Nocardia transvalensis]MBB5917319.1 hypothetical protein [Nocardia transvalensis]
MPVWPGMLAPARPRRRGRGGWWGIVAGAVAVVGGVAAMSGVVLGRGEARVPTTAEALVGVVDVGLGGGPGCEAVRSATLVRGNGPGSTGSGPDVILAFQYAYYVARSGAAARAVTAPDAWVSPVEVIDGGIASVPVGTRHCVEIGPRPEGVFAVTIIETRPDRSVRVYRQMVTVGARDGATVITRIDPVRPR